MPKLILLVGPPGSGKSTLASKLFSTTIFTYINQDAQGREHLSLFNEALLRGENILVDRMNFDKAQRARYLLPVLERGYDTEIIVLHESWDTCFKRCEARKDHLTVKNEKNARDALSTFFTKYERVTDDEADKVTRIWPEGDKPSALIVDLDGTLCNTDARQHFVRKGPKEKKDWKRFFEGIPNDPINQWCADIINKMKEDHTIVYCSGRSEDNRKVTVEWLNKNNLYFINSDREDYYISHLYMRPEKDSRQDNIVKEIILDFELLTRFTPYFMIDDRDQVVQMWRKRGYTCLQCANGDF